MRVVIDISPRNNYSVVSDVVYSNLLNVVKCMRLLGKDGQTSN